MAPIQDWADELGVALATPDLARNQRNEPGLDKKWAIGDLVLQIPKRDLEGVAALLDGVTESQLRQYGAVARAFPPASRTVKAAWSVYRELRDVPEPERSQILVDGLTLRAVRRSLGKGDMDRPRRDRQSTEERAQFVLEELNTPAVKELVLSQVEGSKQYRKAQRVANRTLNEIDASKKFIDSEVRKQKAKPTEDQQYYTFMQKVLEATQLLHSLTNFHVDHEDLVPEHRWKELSVQVRQLETGARGLAEELEGEDQQGYWDVEPEPDYMELGAGGDVVDAELVDE